MNTFEKTLAFGKLGESKIAEWLKARNNSVLPVYEKEIDEGKGPVFFSRSGQHVAPDMLVFPDVEWIEAKHKKVWTWHRKTQRWVTGIDLSHYQGYEAVQIESGRRVWIFFLHLEEIPDSRDLECGCPAKCPVGLFGNSLDYLKKHENHRHENWGRHGMVYWAHEKLKLLATLEEVDQI